jgi:lamin tail-like protein
MPGMKIITIAQDPPGSNLSGERVLLENQGSAAADLSGWTLRPQTGPVFTFPAFSLPPGAQVRVWTRAGANNSTDLYWGRDAVVWTGGPRGTASLRDSQDGEVTRYTYRNAQPLPVSLGGGGAMYCPTVSPHNPDVIYVSCDMGGVYRTPDAGQNWTLVDGRVVRGSGRFSVAFDPVRQDHLLGFHASLGLQESFDGGFGWSPFSPALPTTFPAASPAALLGCLPNPAAQPYDPVRSVAVTAAAFCPDRAGRLLIGTARGIYLLDGPDWRWVYPAPGPVTDQEITDQSLGNVVVNPADVFRFVFVTDPATAATIYFAATGCDVLRSDDQGATWVSISGTLPARPLGILQPGSPSDQRDAQGNPSALDPAYMPSRIRGFAGGSNSNHFVLYVTVSTAECTFPGGAVIRDGGVYFYDSSGNPPGCPPTWVRAMQAPANMEPPSDLDDRNGFYLPRYEHLGVSESDPDTVYVTVINTTYHAPAVYRGVLSGDNVAWTPAYDGFQNHRAGDPRGTTNVEGGWLDQQEQRPPVGLGWGFGGFARGFTAAPTDPNRALFTNNGVVHLTTDGAVQWTQRYTALASGNRDDTTGRWRSVGVEVTTSWHYVIHPGNSNIRFICYTDIGLARSEDGGLSWRSISRANIVNNVRGTAWYNFYELAFEPAPGTRIWAAVSNQHDIPHEKQHDQDPRDGTVLVSTDNGITWSRVPGNGLPSNPVVSILYRQGRLYASVWGSGVYQSTDFGENWSAVAAFPPGTSPHCYRIQFDGSGTLHCVVAPRRVGGFQAGGLYRLVNAQWQSLTTSLESQMGSARLAPTDFGFLNGSDSSVLYLCTASVRGSGGGGGAYQLAGGQWTRLTALDDALSSRGYHDTAQAFAPYALAMAGGRRRVYVTTTSHGVWVTEDGAAPAAEQQWQEVEALPFLGSQRLTWDLNNQRTYVTTFGGGVWSVSPAF